MAGGINTTFQGNLGGDVEVTATRNGTEVARLSVAVSTYKRLEDGSFEDVRVDWVSVSVWGEQIAKVLQLKKGQRVYVEGTLTADAYTPRDGGEPRVGLNVNARSVFLVPRAPRADAPVEPVDWAPAQPVAAGAAAEPF